MGSGETLRFLCREAKSKANSEALALSEQRLSQALQQASEARWGQCDSAGSTERTFQGTMKIMLFSGGFCIQKGAFWVGQWILN